MRLVPSCLPAREQGAPGCCQRQGQRPLRAAERRPWSASAGLLAAGGPGPAAMSEARSAAAGGSYRVPPAMCSPCGGSAASGGAQAAQRGGAGGTTMAAAAAALAQTAASQAAAAEEHETRLRWDQSAAPAQALAPRASCVLALLSVLMAGPGRGAARALCLAAERVAEPGQVPGRAG